MIANEHITITKNPDLPEGQDYFRLRSEGIKLIEQLGSKLWTDYNLHDPGITILETLCYAITDLTYRSSFEVKDLLAEPKDVDRENKPIKILNPEEQAFFTAREILTTAPWTIDDYRKLLIDLDGIKNAWLQCNSCNCGPEIFVHCRKSELRYEKPDAQENAEQHKVIPKGLYDVLLEFEEDEFSGDLNNGKIFLSSAIQLSANPVTLHFEIRFPSHREIEERIKKNPEYRFLFTEEVKITGVKTGVISKLDKSSSSEKVKSYSEVPEDKLAGALRSVLYTDFKITFDKKIPAKQKGTTTDTLVIKNVPLRLVYLKDEVRGKLKATEILRVLGDISDTGAASRYHQKILLTKNKLVDARSALQKHRNITEDFCCIHEVEVEEVGVCADIELTPESDIEKVIGEVYYLIGEYFSPTVRFHTLSEMLQEKGVDEIFDGPKLQYGFLADNDLARTELNRTLYASDIINMLMEVEGIISVKNFVLISYDDDGNRKPPEPWQLKITEDKLPRFYMEDSKLFVFKNNLPLVANTEELLDTMHVMRGRNAMPKLKDAELDLPVPEGNYFPLNEYYSIQNQLPLVYGTGTDGLPASATELRQAQAKQLKAYLIFFEQLLVNYIGQLANLKQLFSLSTSVAGTYFPVLLANEHIADAEALYFNDIVSDEGMAMKKLLKNITESPGEFLQRRNKFLDHLLARFSENFSEYALLLYSYKNQKSVSSQQLINTKTSFLNQFPYLSAFRAQAFDYTITKDIEMRKDMSGLHRRISSLLGLHPSHQFFTVDVRKDDEIFAATLFLNDENGKPRLESTTELKDENRDELILKVNFRMKEILKLISDKTRYKPILEDGKFKVELNNPAVAILVNTIDEKSSHLFSDLSEADKAIDDLIAFFKKNLADEIFLIIEHLLLRPHKKSDALLEVCVEPDCKFCGDEDPYSYRVTFVFNGESELPRKHFDFRRFAERTIRAELPAHVAAKICWVREADFKNIDSAYCEWLAADSAHQKKALGDLIELFNKLKSIYKPATLHDCIDGSDTNRVFLDQTALHFKK